MAEKLHNTIRGTFRVLEDIAEDNTRREEMIKICDPSIIQ